MKALAALLILLLLLGCKKDNGEIVFDEYSLEIIEHEIVDFKLDKPWEELFIGYINVIKVESKWHLWYESFNLDTKKYNEPSFNAFINYAYSDDGIHWVKPALNIHDYNGIDNNILFFNNFIENQGVHGVSVFYDEEASPAERFKMIYLKYDKTSAQSIVCGSISSDGIHWSDERILMNRHSDTQTTLFKHEGRYWMYYRYWSEVSGEWYRKIGLASSSTFDDKFNLHPFEFWDEESTEDVNFYTNSARLLDQNSVIMFPSIFDTENNLMKLRVATSSRNNFSNFKYLESLEFETLFEDYKQKAVAPQSIVLDNENEMWLYVTLNRSGHDGWRHVPELFRGSIGRVKVRINKVSAGTN